MTPELAMVACQFPERLHPVSQLFLDLFLRGRLTTGRLTTPEFLRFFSLPNSDYLPLAECFITVLTG